MRIEVGTAPGTARLPAATARPRRRLDRAELAVLVVFATVSLWVLGLDLWQVIVNGRDWTGTDGVYIVDQLQYLAWIRSASHHLLVSNLFVLRSTPADYFQPAVMISGGLAALGIAPWVTLLLWKPVAVGATFFAVREYSHRSLDGSRARLAAIVLALFFGSFTIIYGSVGVIGDLFPGFLSWGYTFGLLALAAQVAGLVFYDRLRTAGRSGYVPGLIGAGASLLHPWNGELLIVVIVGGEALMWALTRRRPPAVRLALNTIVLTGLPLLYYFLLGKSDLSWELARVASRHSFPLWSITLAILPLLLPAVLAYRHRPTTFLAAATRAWPVAAYAVFLFSASGASATPLHAFQGITVPLAILAVEGVQSVSWRRLRYRTALALAAVALFTIPATADELRIAHQLASPTPDNANFITRDERAALDYLEDNPTPGGVLDAQLSRRRRARQDRAPDARRRLPVVPAALLHACARRPGAVRRHAVPASRSHVRAQHRCAVRARRLQHQRKPTAHARADAALGSPLRLRERVRGGRAGTPARTSGTISRPCGSSRSEAPTALSATKPTRSCQPPTS